MEKKEDEEKDIYSGATTLVLWEAWSVQDRLVIMPNEQGRHGYPVLCLSFPFGFLMSICQLLSCSCPPCYRLSRRRNRYLFHLDVCC